MKSTASFGFEYTIELRHADGRVEREVVHNLIPIEGLNHMMNVTFKGASQVPTWYLGLYEGDYTPLPTNTAANFVGLATESTAYDAATRVEFAEGAVGAGGVDNTATPAAFNFTSLKTIYGGFMSSASSKGAVSGVLMSAVRFASPKVCEAGSTLTVVAGNSLTSA